MKPPYGSYGKHRGLLAFAELKDEARRSRPNDVEL